MVSLRSIFVSAVVVYVGATLRMTYLMKDAGGSGTVPDLKFGFTADSLRELREHTWGEAGCQAYVKASSVDLFPYMEAYTVVLWCLAIVACRDRSTLTKTLAGLLASCPVCFDVTETWILRQTCLTEVSHDWVHVASVANQLKWLSLLGFLIIYLPLWYLARRGRDGGVKAD